jgi:FixJ family two-component response regulator
VRMPGMGGEEFTMQMKKEYPDLPVIVISAFELPDALAGYPFLRKPFKLPQLMDCVNNPIKSNRIR